MEEYLTNNQKEVRLGVIRAVLALSIWETIVVSAPFGDIPEVLVDRILFRIDKNGRTFLSIRNVNLRFFWFCNGTKVQGHIKSLVVYKTTRGYSCLVNVDSGKWIGERSFSFRFRLMETRKGATAWSGKGFGSDNYLGSFDSRDLWLREAFKDNA